MCKIIGSRLSTIPISEWYDINLTGKFERYKDGNAIGGLMFGHTSLVIWQKTLMINKEVINLYAWITPLGLGIQKIGLFLNGCCYGQAI